MSWLLVAIHRKCLALFVHRMQHIPESLCLYLESERAKTATMEAELADLSWSLQHYNSVFADCAELVGVGPNDTASNLDDVIKLLIQRLDSLKQANLQLENQLAAQDQPKAVLNRHTKGVSAIEIKHVWKLYDLVLEKLETIDKLKSQVRSINLRRSRANFFSDVASSSSSEVLSEPVQESIRVLKSNSNLLNLRGTPFTQGPKKKKKRRIGKRNHGNVSVVAGQWSLENDENEENWEFEENSDSFTSAPSRAVSFFL